MEDFRRVIVAGGAAIGLFVLIQLGALALVDPFVGAGLQPVEDPSDPTNPLLYVGAILLATLGMLAAFRFGFDWVVRGAVIFASGFLSWFVLSVVVPPIAVLGGINVIALVAALAVVVGLLAHPEWYVIDAAGILIGAGAAGLFGITFGLLPALVLLVVLAVYDAISVYGTEHMLSLAEGAMAGKLPVVLVVPMTRSYSFIHDEGEDRDALFIGLGDAVIPTILVASAAFFAPVDPIDVPGIALTLPALTAMIGTLLGLLALLALVLKGRAHAGLPLLNGGAIAGYLVGALASGMTLVQALGIEGYL